MDDRPINIRSFRGKQRTTGLNLEEEVRLSELRKMAFAIQKAKFRIEKMFDEIDCEIEKIILKIERLIADYDKDDNERDRGS